MATYAIGDIHGCFDELQLLLAKIAFDRKQDVLWFTGDLINGGSKSIETLQFIKDLGQHAICVLGNHDLALLSIASSKINIPKDNRKQLNFDAILKNPNINELLAWLQSLPLLHYDQTFNTLLVHAGIAPQWRIEKAFALAKEVETILQSEQAPDFFAHMFGNKPDLWDDTLTGWGRLRCITNYLTRLRFCTIDGRMDLLEKGPANMAPPTMMPWYAVPNRLSQDTRIIFGHWAALVGQADNNVLGLDTGCVWGNYLSALRLEDNCIFKIDRLPQ
jgi:bis(5'-nucleosyl)-tetraphosphatase (symmetrical)